MPYESVKRGLEKKKTMKRMKPIALFCCLAFPIVMHAQANQAWLQTLPPPFESIAIRVSTNWLGSVSTNAAHPDPNGKLWTKPKKINTYFHPGAVWEMRSYPVAGGHGHQACYDANGILITQGLGAGTADFVSTVNSWGWTVPSLGHREHDVWPFIRALQLDGNPCLPNSVDIPTDLNRPIMFQGPHLDAYLRFRPPLPTGTRPRS